METNIQSSRRTLRRICKLGQIAGWTVIAVGVIEVGFYAHAHLIAHVNAPHTLYQTMVTASNIFTGLLVLTTAQFLRYLVEEDTKPRWFLRNGHVVLGFFALYLLLTGSLYGWAQLRPMCEMFLTRPPAHMIPMGREIGVTSAILMFLLPPITKALCVLAAAAMLRTVLPILAESKTLA